MNSPEEQTGYNPEEMGNPPETPEASSSKISFDPEKPPGIPKAAVFGKGETVFHKMRELWDAAKAEHEQGTDTGSKGKYEAYANWVTDRYKVMTDSMSYASEEVKNAGFSTTTEEGRKLYNLKRKEFLEARRLEEPK